MNPRDLRDDIPLPEDTAYMNTGASGPSPRRVISAAEQALHLHEIRTPSDESIYDSAFRIFRDTRSSISTHLGVDELEIALTESTGDSIVRLVSSMDWESEDVVVRTDVEHHAGVLACSYLNRVHDVNVRVLDTDGGKINHDEFIENVTDARLVLFSSVPWSTGSRLDVKRLTDIAHDAGARVLVDAAQSIGQHQVDLARWGADAVASSGHKWLLGTWGSGFLYVNHRFANQLHPAQLGYFGVEYPPSEEYALKPGAHRFELGTTSIAPYAALQESLSIIESLGYDTIESHIERLTNRLKSGLNDEQLHSPIDYESGLVVFRVDEPEATVERLKCQDVRIKALPSQGTVRASVHVFNTASDIDRLLSHL